MPITNDIRARADEAVSELREKATAVVTDLRAQAEKRVDLDSIKAAVEPYLEQAKGYAGAVTDRAEELLTTARKDERVARFLDSAESITGVVVETVQEHVVKPVQKLTGVGTPPANTPAEPATVSTVTPTTLPAERPTATPAAKTTAKNTIKTTPAKTPAAKPTTKATAPKAPLTDA
jgi:hypothetical protein